MGRQDCRLSCIHGTIHGEILIRRRMLLSHTRQYNIFVRRINHHEYNSGKHNQSSKYLR